MSGWLWWDSFAEFAAMGGQAGYVWGAYAVAASALGVEVWLTSRRTRRAAGPIANVPVAHPSVTSRRRRRMASLALAAGVLVAAFLVAFGTPALGHEAAAAGAIPAAGPVVAAAPSTP